MNPGEDRRPGQGAAPRFSVEIFPPAEAPARAKLAAGLAEIAPDYVSVTFGAGGTTRDRTFDMVDRLVRTTTIDVAAHLTCVGAGRADVDRIVHHYRDQGVTRIVALRGDPPGGLDVPYAPHPQGYHHTSELVAGILRIAAFDIAVACYPERHPQSASFDVDLDLLQAKADAGARRAITQFFFVNDFFHSYLERVRRRGISLPIVPGILPVVNFTQVRSFAAKCGATVPAWLADRFEGLDDDPQERARIGADIAAEQIAALREAGIGEFHIYCLNRPAIVAAVRNRLAAQRPASAAA